MKFCLKIPPTHEYLILVTKGHLENYQDPGLNI